MKKNIGSEMINGFTPYNPKNPGLQIGNEVIRKYNKEKHCSLERGYAGFTIIEILVILAIVAAVALFGGLSLYGVFKEKAIESDATRMAFSLRAAREKAISQEGGSQWGAHFESSVNSSGFYAVFSGPAFIPGTSAVYKNLDASVRFINPAPGNSLDIIFSKVYGLPSTSTSIIISLKSDISRQKIISVSQNGEIQY